MFFINLKHFSLKNISLNNLPKTIQLTSPEPNVERRRTDKAIVPTAIRP